MKLLLYMPFDGSLCSWFERHVAVPLWVLAWFGPNIQCLFRQKHDFGRLRGPNSDSHSIGRELLYRIRVKATMGNGPGRLWTLRVLYGEVNSAKSFWTKGFAMKKQVGISHTSTISNMLLCAEAPLWTCSKKLQINSRSWRQLPLNSTCHLNSLLWFKKQLKTCLYSLKVFGFCLFKCVQINQNLWICCLVQRIQRVARRWVFFGSLMLTISVGPLPSLVLVADADFGRFPLFAESPGGQTKCFECAF